MKIAVITFLCTLFIVIPSSATFSLTPKPYPVWFSAVDYQDNDNFPEFSIEDFNVQQNVAGREAEIKFTLKSNGLLYYHVSLKDKDNEEIKDISGFVNSNSQYVSLKKTSTQPGEYKVTIELVDNNKMTVTRNYHITLN
ncbi:hypothetical protein OP862_05790 [Yersinia massiliensis]|uniref:N-acetylglucosamine-binding protein A n=2 Tax=Yersinia TaxID=629 RepID=A0A2R4NM55_9GAMM|nr:MULTISPECIES: hypothetical protein [Yersinia]HEC1649505.1 hypothetical protein [Yersinia enterocolitica]ATM86963.1 hypothetical protein CRN74_13285 [Yersinia frederiksenii]AVX37166.1 hypothetical protein DA391_05570 [Yersinia massiliensis]MCB5318344.1 hypothetical protein [Yersinia massiliensis]MDA5549425.1 hypothetical protein [Yersinia massiliensis]